MAQLPPKIPPHMTQNWPLFPHHSHNSQTLIPPPPSLPNMAAAPPTSTAAAATHHNQPSPNLSWVDEFLGFSSTRRGHHRRSVSDHGVMFSETAEMLGPFVDHQHDNGFERLDDDQFLSMFTDDMSLDLPHPTSTTALSSPLSTPPSDQNSNNEDQVKPCQLSENLLQLQDAMQQQHPFRDDNSSKADPKRVKRILANRQSAQRSRVRKLQYISELERTVTSLQSEVSALSPRVAFLDHQRLILNVDNSALKQRIAAFAQDKLFKDAHQEALKREIERLRQIYNQQTLKNKNNNNNGDQESNPTMKPLLSPLQQIPLQLSTPDMAISCSDK
ncbi:unnamed protein product [Rhodiola kirilowii]